jgi:phosphate transport system substrate-binding protein
MFNSRVKLGLALVALSLTIVFIGCGGSSDNADTQSDKTIIQNAGSDTMVNLAQAWAEQYAAVDASVSVEVSGGGSGTGIAALINGTVDLVNSSRKIEPEEAESARLSGHEPEEFIVGYDALAVYVHKDNPLNEITIEQLADIYGEDGNISKWSQLGIDHGACGNDEIIRVSRQSNSGTYHYFREALLGTNRDFRLGSRDLHGSKDVVELIAQTPCAIGYSGMGYATEEVKTLKIARKSGETFYAPSIETTLAETYPIARPLYMYTSGTPNEATKEYLTWIYSDVGQKLVKDNGYVPLPPEKRMMQEQASGE